MELVNGPDFYDEAYPWIGERKLTILANTDARSSTPRALHRPKQQYTLLFAKSADLAGVRNALIS